jgi:hypothetical protein
MALFESIPFLEEAVLFLLVFVVVFAILQKSKILGDNVSKINSLVALSFALIFVGVSSTTDLISRMIPFVAVALSVILMFLLLWGFVGGEIGSLPKGIKNTLITLSAIFMIVLVLYISGWWTDLKAGTWFNSGILYTVLAFVAVVAAVVYVIVSSKTN